MDIKAGFQLHITSYTNDGDDYNTTIHNGLSEDDVRFLLALVEPFKSRHCGGKWGNENVKNHIVDDHVRECFEAHPNQKHSAYIDWLDEDESMGNDGLSDLVTELVGHDEYCGWRVFVNFEVYFIPDVIKDVSGDFK